MKVLLDTNICIAVMCGHERAVTRLAAVSPADCAVSVVTVYELFTGSRQMPGARARAGEGGALAGRDERALI